MKYMLFDVESTGLGLHDEVIQFAGFLLQEDFATIEKIVNFYCDTDTPISAGALAAHHITATELHKRSGGVTFEQRYQILKDIFDQDDITFITYNAAFDFRIFNQTLTNNGLAPYKFPPIETRLHKSGRHSLCLMNASTEVANGGRKRKNIETVLNKRVLTEFYNSLNINGRLNGIIDPNDTDRLLQAMNAIYASICKQHNLEDSGTLHNALYDTFLSWLILQTYGNQLIV